MRTCYRCVDKFNILYMLSNTMYRYTFDRLTDLIGFTSVLLTSLGSLYIAGIRLCYKSYPNQLLQARSAERPCHAHASVLLLLCRWGPAGQGRLLCEMHAALVRVLEGLDEDLMEAPTMAGYGSATDLAPVDSYRPLLGAAWPELARRYLQEHAALSIGEDAVEAVLRLKVSANIFCACKSGLQGMKKYSRRVVS